MDVNPYESPADVEEPSLPPPATPGPIWLEILYLALTAAGIVILIPAIIVLCIVMNT